MCLTKSNPFLYSYRSQGKLACDWLGGGLEAVRSLTFWTENHKIEEYLLSKYERV
jgi:hypothetical protein